MCQDAGKMNGFVFPLNTITKSTGENEEQVADSHPTFHLFSSN